MVDLRSLSIRYGSQTAIEEVSLSISPGEFLLVSGPSGCGKSTLARLLAGLIPAVIPASVQGQVWVAGLDPTHTPPARMASQVGIVFQNPATQLFCLTVAEEVSFGPNNLGIAPAEVLKRTAWALDATGLSDLRLRTPASLSSGEQQRVAIAAELAMGPPLLVLDEPLASLDAPGAHRVLDTLAELNRKHGVTVVVIEHRLAEVVRVARRVVLMDQGRIVADGPPGEVSQESDLLRRLGMRPPDQSETPDWTQMLEGNGRSPEEGALVELRGVTAGYNGHPAIHEISLSLHPGEFVALVGDNGSGKTTLARVLAGLMRPQRGRVRRGRGRRARPGLDVGLLFQNPLDQLLTDRVDAEVAMGPLNCGIFDRATHEQTMAVADLVALRDRLPTLLSAGQQQRTTLAAALALRPRLLILDEPTLGQDWGHLERLMDFVAHLNQRGNAVLLITHDHMLAARYARRILLMREGRLVADGVLKHRREIP